MKEIDIREELGLSIIKTNETWLKVLNYVESLGEEDVKLVFDFVSCYSPLDLSNFRRLIAKNNIYAEFIDCKPELSDELAKNINLTCILDGYKEGRFTAKCFKQKIETPPISVTTAADRICNQLAEKAIINEETGICDVRYCDIYTQLGSPNTIQGIISAILKIYEEKGAKNYILYFSDYSINPEIVDALANKIVQLSNKYDISVDVDMEDEDTINYYKSSLYKYTSTDITIQRKFRGFQKLKYNTAGQLIKYKHTRAVDNLGREGHGKKVASRVAVYRGLATLNGYKKTVNMIPKEILDKYTVDNEEEILYNEKGEQLSFNNIYIIIDELPLKYFQTHAYFSCSDDEEENELAYMDSLPFQTQKIPLTHIGLYGEFIGRRYHFLEPWQESLEESEKVITGFDSNNFIHHEVLTVPQRIKLVFDDWEVDYNKEELNKAIEKNNDYLKEKQLEQDEEIEDLQEE